jgi:hypothetical protein
MIFRSTSSGVPMKQRKVAISLAVVGAIAAPFVFRTYKMKPLYWVVVPYTAKTKEKVTAYVTNNCQGITENNVHAAPGLSRQYCLDEIGNLKRGGDEHAYCCSTRNYLAINAIAAAAGFVIIYALTFLLPALIRRYWRWLNT